MPRDRLDPDTVLDALERLRPAGKRRLAKLIRTLDLAPRPPVTGDDADAGGDDPPVPPGFDPHPHAG